VSDYILADDLSGALEAGVAFRKRGWRVTLPLDIHSACPPAPGELRVINSETRSMTPEDAGAVVRRTLADLKAEGARLLLKKIDSTLRGPIGAELAAALEVLAPPLVVVCPANPAAGRTVRDGALLVGGVPLAETDFRSDPRWPAGESRVGAVLAAQGTPPAASLSLAELRQNGAPPVFRQAMDAKLPVLVSDAESWADLQALVHATLANVPDALLVGSGALAAALSERLPAPGESVLRPQPAKFRRMLVLCGSGHPASERQLECLASRHRVAVVPFVGGATDRGGAAKAVAASLADRGVAAVRFSTSGPRSGDSAMRLQAEIRRFAGDLFKEGSPETIYVTGGETAWTVCHALGGLVLEVIAELDLGVVLSQLTPRGDGQRVNVITKPGGFGGDAVIADFVEEI